MSELRRAHLLAYALAGVLIVVAGGRWLHAAPSGRDRAPDPPRVDAGVRVDRPAGEAVVHVAGAGREPGVYHLGAGTRVQEAVRRAGGPTRRADLDALNLAAQGEDGRPIIVPAPAAPAAVAPAPGAAARGAPAVPVNLNSASADELGTLDGVGPATAQKIMAYRDEHGGFGSVDELDQVPGIGEKKLAALRPHVTV